VVVGGNGVPAECKGDVAPHARVRVVAELTEQKLEPGPDPFYPIKLAVILWQQHVLISTRDHCKLKFGLLRSYMRQLHERSSCVFCGRTDHPFTQFPELLPNAL
jgi:hypothetical protein